MLYYLRLICLNKKSLKPGIQKSRFTFFIVHPLIKSSICVYEFPDYELYFYTFILTGTVWNLFTWEISLALNHSKHMICLWASGVCVCAAVHSGWTVISFLPGIPVLSSDSKLLSYFLTGYTETEDDNRNPLTPGPGCPCSSSGMTMKCLAGGLKNLLNSLNC